ncbi:MAG: DeoR/GlpR family DNA-binding transcription regulator [Akkermansiaceae bacterium]|nr:DeoR/GlpR family DNA-binding transcription regulator [Akkermansiaceae bacterium]
MLAIERQRRILERAKQERAVRTQELSAILKVTEETVRRDLDTLSKQGLLRRTHGGAADVSIMLDELSQSDREVRQADEKTAIAKHAAKHVEDNETIMLDASSTALEFARHLPSGKSLRVVTYAHSIVEKLSIRSDIELVLLGGTYEAKGRRFRGMLTEMGIRALRIDRFFFSGGGYHETRGIGEPSAEEARLKATIIAHADWKCAMLDHTKLGRTTDHFFVKSSEIDLFITDSKGADFCKSGAMKGMKVEIA